MNKHYSIFNVKLNGKKVVEITKTLFLFCLTLLYT